VFFVTTASSIFAYLWVVLILTRFSENYVDLWEAVLTFLFFPVLVVTAYLTDKGCFRRGRQRAAGTEDEEQPNKPETDAAETKFCKPPSKCYVIVTPQSTIGYTSVASVFQ